MPSNRVLKSTKKQQKVELLKRVRKMLARPKGWSKGSWEQSNLDREYPAYCLATACQVAASELHLLKPEEDARSAQGLVERLVGLNVMYSTSVADEISLLYSTSVADEISLLRLVKQRGAYSIPNFNDREGTTRKDVLAVVDERIAQLEAGK